jgi:hypothetical protein
MAETKSNLSSETLKLREALLAYCTAHFPKDSKPPLHLGITWQKTTSLVNFGKKPTATQSLPWTSTSADLSSTISQMQYDDSCLVHGKWRLQPGLYIAGDTYAGVSISLVDK